MDGSRGSIFQEYRFLQVFFFVLNRISQCLNDDPHLVALVLFIFAVTSGSIDGWGTAEVIAPLILSILLFVAFFTWEARQPEEIAAV